jgi:hypothetical protein
MGGREERKDNADVDRERARELEARIWLCSGGHEERIDIIASAIAEVREEWCVAARRLVDALDTCEGNRGRFSCVGVHDNRCPKSLVESPEKWRGEWRCECGSEELDAASEAIRNLLTRRRPRRTPHEMAG